MKKISIALCTYNGAKFLPEQLKSYLAQTRLPDELIVGDDGSTDETVALLKDFAKTAPFAVRLEINEKNLGSTKNFERTIALCTGDLIFLSDQDDVWHPQKVEKFSAEFEKSENVGMVFSDAELVGENLESLKHNLWDFSFPPADRRAARSGNLFELLLKRNVVTGATMAFRASFKDDLMPIPIHIPNFIHDAWIALVIAAKGKIVFIEESYILYRQHSNQQLGINWKFKDKMPRREKYAESIFFERKNQERFAVLAEVIETYPQFEKQDTNVLSDRLRQDFMRESEQKILHYEARKNLPANRLKRLSPVIKEFSSGRYRKFSKGLTSAAKDLFESW